MGHVRVLQRVRRFFFGPSQLERGLAYLFGLPGRGIFYRAQAPQAADPDHSGFCDCAGCQCAMCHFLGIPIPSFYMNSGSLWAWCEQKGTATRDPATIAHTRDEAGWWLFVGPNGDEHIAISTGNSRQFAAHSPSLGIGFASWYAHAWYGVAKIPGMSGYPGQQPQLPPSPEADLVLDAQTQEQIKLLFDAALLDMFNGPGVPQQNFRDGFRRIVDNALHETFGDEFIRKAKASK